MGEHPLSQGHISDITPSSREVTVATAASSPLQGYSLSAYPYLTPGSPEPFPESDKELQIDSGSLQLQIPAPPSRSLTPPIITLKPRSSKMRPKVQRSQSVSQKKGPDTPARQHKARVDPDQAISRSPVRGRQGAAAAHWSSSSESLGGEAEMEGDVGTDWRS